MASIIFGGYTTLA